MYNSSSSLGETIVASGSLCRGLYYKLNNYSKSVENLACAILDSQAISDAKLWHAHSGHLNFASLRHLLDMYVRATYWVKCSVLLFPKMVQ